MTYPELTAIPRSIAYVNVKGGVGKTSLVSHTAGLLALAGHRVLLVDLDLQGNTGEDFGYTARGLGDDGEGFARLVQYGGEPYIVRDVRPGLDVIPGGEHMRYLDAALSARREMHGAGAPALAIANALDPIADAYDFVLMDCPPGHGALQVGALAACSYYVVPTKTDMSSRLGMVRMQPVFAGAIEVNPGLLLLGVVIFGVTPAAKKITKEVREWVEASLGGQAPVFKTIIRHVEAPAYHVRQRGQLVHELEMGPDAGVPAALAKAATGLSEDYSNVTAEVVTRLLELEAQRA